MTNSDLDRIEGELGVRLPTAYRRAVAPFPVPACVGNTDTALWDDPAALIDLNEQLRAGLCCVRPWSTHMFALRRDGGGSAAALDLRDPLGPVVWADRCHLAGPGSGPASPSFEAWVAEVVADLRADLEGNGIDPDGTPEERERAARDGAAADGRVLMWVAVAATLVAAGVIGVAAAMGGGRYQVARRPVAGCRRLPEGGRVSPDTAAAGSRPPPGYDNFDHVNPRGPRHASFTHSGPARSPVRTVRPRVGRR